MILAKEKYDYYDLEQISRPSKKLKKVRKLKINNNRRLVAVGVVLCFFILGLLLTARYAQIATTGYKINSMKKQLAALESDNDRLEIEVNKLQSLDRIEKVATEKLGMQRPNDGEGIQLVTVEPDKSTDAPKAKQAPVQAAEQKQGAKTTKKVGFLEALTNLIGSKKGDNARADAKPLN